MTFAEVAAMLAASAFAVLVGFLVPVLIRLRTTVAEAGRVLATLNAGLPALISEVLAMSRTVNELVKQAGAGVAPVSALLHAAGQVGESVQRAHNAIRGSSERALANAAGIIAGIKAAMQVLQSRWRRRREEETPRSASEGVEEGSAATAAAREPLM